MGKRVVPKVIPKSPFDINPLLKSPPPPFIGLIKYKQPKTKIKKEKK